MRRVTSLGLLLVWVIGGIPSYGFAQGAQGKKACDLVTRADVESLLGVTLEEPTSTSYGSSCSFTNWAPNKPRPPKRVDVQVLVNHSAAPDPAAVEKWRKMIDENTYHNPIDFPEFGDAAFWHGSPQYATVTVFTGGTLVLTVQGAVTLEQSKALALKALGGPAKTGLRVRDAAGAAAPARPDRGEAGIGRSAQARPLGEGRRRKRPGSGGAREAL